MTIIHYVRAIDLDAWGGTEASVIKAMNVSSTFEESIVYTLKADKNTTQTKSIKGYSLKKFNYFYPYLCLNNEKYKMFDRKGGNPISLSMLWSILTDTKIKGIHLHTMGFQAALITLIAKIKRIPTYITLHGGQKDVTELEKKYFKSLYQNTKCLLGPLQTKLNNESVIKNVSEVICVGLLEYKFQKKKYEQKVHYIPNCVSEIKTEEDQLSDIICNLVPKKYILNVGRIDPQKDQLLCIRSFKKFIQTHPDFKLILVGSVTDKEYFKKIKDYISENKLKDHVLIVGQVKPNSYELKWLYNNAFCLSQTSRHEPFGITVIEAMANDCPVIATKVGGMGEIFSNNCEGLYLENKCPEALAKLYHALIPIREQFIKRAKVLIETKYSNKVINKKLSSLYARSL